MTEADPTLHVLIVGRLFDIVDETCSRVQSRDVVLHGATNLDEVRAVLSLEPIDVMVVGAAIELAERLAITRAAFELSDHITVHMKDRASGPPGFVPFVEGVIASRRHAR